MNKKLLITSSVFSLIFLFSVPHAQSFPDSSLKAQKIHGTDGADGVHWWSGGKGGEGG